MRERIVGRDAELGALDAFLGRLPSAARAMLITGAPGAGKTTLLDAAAERARGAGIAVLMTRPSPSDIRLAFAGLADILGQRLETAAGDLPPAQRRALGTALLIEDAPAVPPDPPLIAAAVRSALRALAREVPVLIAVDDVQWLDGPTVAALGFAFRRMTGEPVGLICAQRLTVPGQEQPLDLRHARAPVDVLPLDGLSLGALHHLLRRRLGVSFSHPMLRRVAAASQGNPFIALEIGAALTRRGQLSVGTADLPVPATLNGLVGERLAELPATAAAALQLVAVMPGALVAQYLEAGADGSGLDEAVSAGVLGTDGGRLRFAHPLLASAVAGGIPPLRRRELHAAAARISGNPEQRARHLAHAVLGASAAVASELDASAQAAVLRGAPATAAELLELAAAITPESDQPVGRRRLLAAARHLSTCGETRAARVCLEELVASMPPGPQRAEALSQLGWLHVSDFAVATTLLQQALAEANGEAAISADIRFCLSDVWSNRGDQERALAESRRALADAERSADQALIANSLTLVFDNSWMAGQRPDERLLDRAVKLERSLSGSQLRYSPSRSAGIYHYMCGRLDEAEDELQRVLAWAEERGIEDWRADMLLRLAQIARRRGDGARAAELADSAIEVAEQLDLPRPLTSALYVRAAVALQRGEAGTVGELARRGMELARRAGDEPIQVCYQALLGSLDLVTGHHQRAAERLVPLAGQLAGVGWHPTTQAIAPDVAEALIGAGRLEDAGALLTKLEHAMPDLVTAALAARCRGMLAAARGELETATSLLVTALRLHGQVSPQPVERARTLLVLGGVQRRRKQRATARVTLSEAISLFEQAGAPLWAARARAELARISGRPPGPDTLSAAESRAAVLAATGLSNKQIAAELFVTVRAVESTLTKAYAKLGISSRTQLAGRLRAPR